MARQDRTEVECCTPKPKIEERPLFDTEKAANLEATFKVLANATRLRLLHALIREPDICVGELAHKLEMKIQAISNQLQLLMLRGIVSSRRDGNKISYRIVDPCIISLLDYGLCLTEDLYSGSKQRIGNALEKRGGSPGRFQ
jgi:DNA-binding transcriptional ArsR family regulator